MEEIKLTKKRWLVIIIIFYLLTILFSVFLFVQIRKQYSSNQQTEQKKITSNAANQQSTNKIRRYLDGVWVEAGAENTFPVAVIIDNFDTINSQLGLNQASLVYEAEVEGRITRYLAIFSNYQSIKEIGPIRSARPYFVDWAEEYSALFVHCGGSPEALVKIAKENVFDFNEFYNGSYFWRKTNEQAPHNVYTSGEQLVSYLDKKKVSTGKFLTWNFNDDTPLTARPNEQKIIINFLGKSQVSWQYNKTNNAYYRYLGNKRQLDKNGEDIVAKNIIVQYVSAVEIDQLLRIKMVTIGQGKALVCLDGKCEEGYWEKKNRGSRTRFYQNNQEEFTFNAGTTWVEVVRPEYKIEY